MFFRKRKKETVEISRNEQLKREFLEYYKNTEDEEIQAMVGHIRETGSFQMINNTLFNNYYGEVKVNKDEIGKYVIDDEIKVYFPDTWDDEHISSQYLALKKEQDPLSPHCYLDKIDKKNILNAKNKYKRVEVLELGAMEGMFSLGLVEIADKIHLFEVDEKWSNALEKSFLPWKQKVIINNKFVDAVSNKENNVISIDDYIRPESGVFYIVKMDIEGKETDVLKGMCEFIEKSENFMAFICCYHRENDEKIIREMLKKYQLRASKGYFCFYADKNYREPYVRRCMIKALKKSME